jgi:hypothetical protein
VLWASVALAFREQSNNMGILTDIRSSLGLNPETTEFNSELMIHIDSGLDILDQVGFNNTSKHVYDDENISITDLYPTLSSTLTRMAMQYLFIHVKLIFDPPAPTTFQYMKDLETELEWRIRLEFDTSNSSTISEVDTNEIADIKARLAQLEENTIEIEDLFNGSN